MTYVLNLLEGDVFSLREFHDVLDTVDDLESTGGVHFCDVTSVEPSLGINSSCRVGIILR